MDTTDLETASACTETTMGKPLAMRHMKISLQILSKNAQLETVEDLSTLGFYYICICKCRAERSKRSHGSVDGSGKQVGNQKCCWQKQLVDPFCFLLSADCSSMTQFPIG